MNKRIKRREIDCTNLDIMKIPESLDVEYDQGDVVVVHYDDLYDLIRTIKRVKEYAHTCGMLRQEPSTGGLREALEE